MGTAISGQQAFGPKLLNQLGATYDGSAARRSSGDGPAAKGVDSFATTGASAGNEDASLVFQRTFQRLAVALEFQQASLQVNGQNGDEGNGGEGASASAYAEQLTFSFFFEAQSEQVSLFRQRTDAVADGQEGAARESFLATRERIAVRFELNAEITSAALNGFAGTAEEASNNPKALSSLLDTTNGLLDQETIDFFNQIFGLFDDFLNGEGDLEERFNQLLAGLEELGLITPGFGTGGGQPASEGSTVTAQAQRFSFQFEFEFESESVSVEKSDPIVLDLDGDGIELTSYENGATFDITATGRQSRTAFVTGGDAFLALDRNNNGRIDDGAELFGDQRGAANGFEELRTLDSNSDGIIDANDPVYDLLRLFRDNGDGQTDDGELIGLREAGIASISLGYDNVNIRAAGGNQIAQIASFQRTNGTTGTAADALLNYLA